MMVLDDATVTFAACVLIYVLVVGLPAMWIAEHLHGRPGLGFLLGVLFGPLGWILALFVPDKDKPFWQVWKRSSYARRKAAQKDA